MSEERAQISHFADVETSSSDYAARFSGAVGEWLLEVQSKALLHLLKDFPAATVLDVAGGHGQIARALGDNGYSVTVLGSATNCDTQISDLIKSGKCSFQVGSVEELPFADKSFDVVTCFRYLAHTDNWQEVIAESARVARKLVIMDYAPSSSFNFLSPLLFQLKLWIEGNTRTYKVFKHSDIKEAFERSGYAESKSISQFFLPMAFHRALKVPGISAALEGTSRAFGLTRLFGSPVITSFKLRTV